MVLRRSRLVVESTRRRDTRSGSVGTAGESRWSKRKATSYPQSSTACRVRASQSPFG